MKKNDIDTACSYAFHQPFFPEGKIREGRVTDV